MSTATTSLSTNRSSSLASDLRSGFMVFLIALPLCLGIAGASGCPPIAGIYTAIAGGIIATLLSNSQLTIKGPAAGLIVIVLGCVADCTTFAKDAGLSEGDAALAAYKMMLAVAVISGLMQIAFGALKGGVLGDFFPSSAVHGLLASIGVIIMAKQLPVAFGVPKEFLMDAHGHSFEPLDLIMHLPTALTHFNPLIAVIGITGLIIMFGMPSFFPKLAKRVPAQLIVLIATIPLALFVLHVPFPGAADYTYSAFGGSFTLAAKKHLVNVPLDAVQTLGTRALDLTRMVVFPDFSILKQVFAWKWIALFAIIGSLESLLSSKAVDTLDPLKRKTDLNRDLLAVGVANTVVAFLGGIPMIAEIVRSRANIDNGAKSKFSNMFHGMFLLAAVAFIPTLLNLIPLAALAAMLVFTGSRLAHPREFAHVYHIGREQVVVFVATIIGVLATDLLVGIFIGMGVKLLIHFMHGMPMTSLFRPFLNIEQIDDKTCRIAAGKSAVFSNWLLFRSQIYQYGLLQDKNVIVDLSETILVDHTTMEKLHELSRDFESKGLTLQVIGLDQHLNPSQHPQGTRIRSQPVTHAH
ncbi:MAG: SulP family inorganic anion transporter [Planctomycetales bacterium]|nr:SulP family inorganic anion transporter [Planctomycetales bacterium]